MHLFDITAGCRGAFIAAGADPNHQLLNTLAGTHLGPGENRFRPSFRNAPPTAPDLNATSFSGTNEHACVRCNSGMQRSVSFCRGRFIRVSGDESTNTVPAGGKKNRSPPQPPISMLHLSRGPGNTDACVRCKSGLQRSVYCRRSGPQLTIAEFIGRVAFGAQGESILSRH